MPIVGIDLGTTNSLISFWDNDKVVLIPNALGSSLTPSVVGVDADGDIHVGQVAKERLSTHPNMTVAAFKRYMGTKKTFPLGNYDFLPEELSSFVIRSLKQDAESYLNQTVDEAVVSVPAYFSDAQRKATQRAAELAGLKVERLINEPTAAAIAYGLHDKASETKYLIFDLGGGTFDVSIVELFENVIEVKAIAGDNFLGGEDFTDLLAALFMERHRIDKRNLDLKAYTAIRTQAEICKQTLGRTAEGHMACRIAGSELDCHIDRHDFNLASKPLIEKLRKPVERALSDAALKTSDLDAIILVGGATRMPLVHTLVSRLFGRFPTCSLNPDEVVALGVGIQAGMKERNALLKENVLTDVCPYTLGVGVAVWKDSGYEAGHYSPIMERNTVIPASRVERFSTVADDQTNITIEIFQGENRLTKNNIKLGELKITVPPAPAGEQEVDVRFTYDINSILEVEAKAVATGMQKCLIIEEGPGAMPKEEIDRRLARLADIKIHPRDKQENRLLVARGERLYEESLGPVRQEIASALQIFEEALNRQNDREIKKAAETLKVDLDEIEKHREF